MSLIFNDDEPGPDHWTRDDIESALGCLEFIASALESIITAAVQSGALPANAMPDKGG